MTQWCNEEMKRVAIASCRGKPGTPQRQTLDALYECALFVVYVARITTADHFPSWSYSCVEKWAKRAAEHGARARPRICTKEVSDAVLAVLEDRTIDRLAGVMVALADVAEKIGRQA